MKILIIVLLVLATTSCTLAWKHGYQVRSSNENGIEIAYDPDLVSHFAMQQEVKKHCAKYNKVPEVDDTTWGATVFVNKERFKCVSE